MIGDLFMTAFQIGKDVSFTYLKDAKSGITANGTLTKDYASKAQNYEGKVVDVRNIGKNPLSNDTLRYGSIKGERSENLVTVELPDGQPKAFYDGRMVNAQVGNDS
jgi:hypothetical protein|tara:strand:+ start:1018 stop:1335 length:318 start_codon:yes stop_codon:yes gene_type:complete